MRYLWFALFGILFTYNVNAQKNTDLKGTSKDSITVVDSLYREDQFYISITHNLMQSKPGGYKQRGFSPGVTFGFLRDMPLNKKRNFAFALGAGYSFLSIKHNLKASELNGNNFFEVVPENSFDKDKLELHSIDIPFEVRWRTSRPQSHKFFRIYAGVKGSYVFANKAVFKDTNENIRLTKISEINKLTASAYMAVGYNTWNFYFNYGITPIFKPYSMGNETLKLNNLNVGFIFYIL